MNNAQLAIAIGLPVILLITWGIHYTAWHCGRLAGLAEADRRLREDVQSEMTRQRLRQIGDDIQLRQRLTEEAL